MAYHKYKSGLFIRTLILFIALSLLAYLINKIDFAKDYTFYLFGSILVVILILIAFKNLYKFTSKRFEAIDDFFESVKYRDFSRRFSEESDSEDIIALHKGFNAVNATIKEINKEKEVEHLYLQKILELIDTGIIAYNTESAKILWVNDSFKKTLEIPSIKTVRFIESRKPKLFEAIFEKNYAGGETILIELGNEKIKILIFSSTFIIGNDTFKLIALQNIGDTLNRMESEAWRKLLSVMTHEIMNSIAPISSLAETLQSKVQLSIQDPSKNPLEINDLDIGIESIKKRSEGLLKFAKTYRSLNKIPKLNLNKTLVSELFESIKTLMAPSLTNKNIELTFEIDSPKLEIEIDSYLIDQVLINLILNSVEACKERVKPKINLRAYKNIEGQTIIKINDNGKGIPDEIIDELFVPFFSTKKNGSGIGLSLCKEIMLLHKGKIQIKSIEEKGTMVSLLF